MFNKLTFNILFLFSSAFNVAAVVDDKKNHKDYELPKELRSTLLFDLSSSNWPIVVEKINDKHKLNWSLNSMLIKWFEKNTKPFISFLKGLIARKEIEIFSRSILGINDQIEIDKLFDDLFSNIIKNQLWDFYLKESNEKSVYEIDSMISELKLNVYSSNFWHKKGDYKWDLSKVGDASNYYNKDFDEVDFIKLKKLVSFKNGKNLRREIFEKLFIDGTEDYYQTFDDDRELFENSILESIYKSSSDFNDEKIDNFKFYLWVRYQDYVNNKFMTETYDKLFNIAFILNSFFYKNKEKNQPELNVNSYLLPHLQNIVKGSSNKTWDSKFKFLFNLTTKTNDYENGVKNNADFFKNFTDKNDFLNEDGKELNNDFKNKLNFYHYQNIDRNVFIDKDFSKIIDPIFSIPGFKGIYNPSFSDINFGNGSKEIIESKSEQSWVKNNELNYWKDGNNVTFGYVFPIYFISLIEDMFFSAGKKIIINESTLNTWNRDANEILSSSKASKFIKKLKNDKKLSIFYQMLNLISTNQDIKQSSERKFWKKYFPKKEMIINNLLWEELKNFYDE